MASVRGTDGTAVIYCHKGRSLTEEFLPESTGIVLGFGLNVIYNKSSQTTELGLRFFNLSSWTMMSSTLDTKPQVTLPAVSVPSLGSFDDSSDVTFSGTIAPGMRYEHKSSAYPAYYIFTGTPTTAGVFNYMITVTQQVKNWRGVVQSEWLIYFPIEFHIYANSYLNQNANGGIFPDHSTVKTQTVDGYTAPTYTITTIEPTRTGHTFLGWSTSSTATSASYHGGGTYTGVLDGTSTLFAVWTPNTYNVSLTAGTGGTVSGGGPYSFGSTANISATPNSGYRFVQWSDGNTSASRSFLVTGNVTLSASFEPLIATTNVKVNGAWTKGSVYVKVNGQWVESKKIYVKVNGNWVEGS